MKRRKLAHGESMVVLDRQWNRPLSPSCDRERTFGWRIEIFGHDQATAINAKGPWSPPMQRHETSNGLTPASNPSVLASRYVVQQPRQVRLGESAGCVCGPREVVEESAARTRRRPDGLPSLRPCDTALLEAPAYK